MAYTVKTDQEKLFELCWQMEQAGNTGWYDGDMLIGAAYLIRASDESFYSHRELYGLQVKTIPAALRKGMLYYSSGWGWRVRKNPHWFAVFCERFPETVKMWQEGTV